MRHKQKKTFFLLFGMLMVIYAVSSANGETILKEDFETGNYSNNWSVWLQDSNCNTGTTLRVNSQAAHRGSYGLGIHYILDDDPRGDCQLHQDNNTCLVYHPPVPLKHYFFRGYFKFKLNANDLCSSPTVQRKLIYFKPENYNAGGWAFFIVAWPWGNNCDDNGYCLSLAYIGNGAMGATLWGDGSPGFNKSYNHIRANEWYYLEVEVQYRTYGKDIVRIWLAPDGETPKKIFERTDLTLRSESDASSDIGLGTIEVGRQVDVNRSSYNQGWIDEYRYWDDIVIGTEFIGPVGSSGSPPGPPQNARIAH